MNIQSNPVSNQHDITRLTNLPVLDHVPLKALHIYAPRAVNVGEEG